MPAPTAYRNLWMIRNEDFFTLRWADPGFARTLLQLNSQADIGGCFIGSEAFIPATDYSRLASAAGTDWTWAFEKNWLMYLIWGRLLYDPATPDAVFAAAIDARYGRGTGVPLLSGFSRACTYLQSLGSFHPFTWDLALYMEGFLRGEGKLISVDDLRTCLPIDPSLLSVKAYVDGQKSGEFPVGASTPLQLADRAEANAKAALAAIAPLDAAPPALDCGIDDIKAWAQLGFYFAEKLRAAVALEQGRRSGNAAELATAEACIQRAIGHWQSLIEVTRAHYRPQPLEHTGSALFSWEALLPQVQHDLDLVRAAAPAHQP